eukprot:jgi/Mesvir1/9751/Mv12212-RA.2
MITGPHTVFIVSDALIQGLADSLCQTVGNCHPFPVVENCYDQNGSYEYCIRHHTLPGRVVTFDDITSAEGGQILDKSTYYDDPDIAAIAEPRRTYKSQLRINYRNGVLTMNSYPVDLTQGIVRTSNGIIYSMGQLAQASYNTAQHYMDLTIERVFSEGMDNVLSLSAYYFRLAGLGDILDNPRANGDKGLTVLAPSNGAWWRLSQEELIRLSQPEHRDELRSILLYHIIPEWITSYSMQNGEFLWTSSWEKTPSWDPATGGVAPKYGSWFPERSLEESVMKTGMFNLRVRSYGQPTGFIGLNEVLFEDHYTFAQSASIFYDTPTQNANLLRVSRVLRPPELRHAMLGLWVAGFAIPISKGPLAGTGAQVYLDLQLVVCDDLFVLYATTIDLSNCTSPPRQNDVPDMYAKCPVAETVRHQLGITLRGDHYPEALGLGPTRDMTVHSHSIQMVLYSQMSVDYYNEVAEGSCAGPWVRGERRELDFKDLHQGCYRHTGIPREAFNEWPRVLDIYPCSDLVTVITQGGMEQRLSFVTGRCNLTLLPYFENQWRRVEGPDFCMNPMKHPSWRPLCHVNCPEKCGHGPDYCVPPVSNRLEVPREEVPRGKRAIQDLAAHLQVLDTSALPRNAKAALRNAVEELDDAVESHLWEVPGKAHVLTHKGVCVARVAVCCMSEGRCLLHERGSLFAV